jgi:F0F1-type ATP synthase assembly protein I
MEAVNEALQIIKGGKTGGYYLAGFFFSFLAVLVSLRVIAQKRRDPQSPNTPRKFSWSFLIGDNLKRILTSMIVMFMLFRLFDLSNPALMIGVGFGVAFGLDKIIQFLIDRTDIMNFLMPPRKQD